MVRDILNLPYREGVDFFKLPHSDEDNAICSNREKAMLNDLLRKCIKLELQSYMQHLRMMYPHKWFTPKKTLSNERSLQDARQEGFKYNFA